MWQKLLRITLCMRADQNLVIIKPSGEWNTTRIIFTPSKVEHWLNGKLVVSFVPWSDDWNKRKSSGKWKDFPDYGKHQKGVYCPSGS